MIWVFVWLVVVFILSWELLALATYEEFIPTWSRIIWALQRKYPKLKWIVLALTLIVGLGTTIWVVIHFFFGECAFGIC